MNLSILTYSLGLSLVATQKDDTVFHISLGDEAPLLLDAFFKLYPQYVKTIFSPVNPDILDKIQETLDKGIVHSELKLELQGTEFQKKIWALLQEHTKLGQTVSYKFIAEKLGKPKAVRSVANAIGANRIAVLIPCHRVIQTNGQSGGYRWGTELKKKLLEKELSISLGRHENFFVHDI